MQQTSGKQPIKLPLAYWLGIGFALGVGWLGILLTFALHNPALGLGIGALTTPVFAAILYLLTNLTKRLLKR